MENTRDEVLALLGPLNLRQQVEVLGNCFLVLGTNAMVAQGAKLPNQISPETVMGLVLDDIKQQGNTVGNSLALQGLELLAWLAK